MSEDSVMGMPVPGAVSDPWTELLRVGARKLLAQAVEAQLADFMGQFAEARDTRGREAVVRHGYQPERRVVTGIGPVPVRVPKVRDRRGEGVVFRSALVPPYVRRAKSVDAALPWLYLKGLSSGPLQEALEGLVGPEAKGLSAPVVSRLKRQWAQAYEAGCQRRLDQDRWVYLGVDGLDRGRRMDDARLCGDRGECAGPEAVSRHRGRGARVGPELARGAARPPTPGP
jgi:putative transposase